MLEIGLSNALMATLLAVVAAVFSVRRCHPSLIHLTCLLVFIKLLTPPVIFLPLPLVERAVDAAPARQAVVLASPLPEALGPSVGGESLAIPVPEQPPLSSKDDAESSLPDSGASGSGEVDVWDHGVVPTSDGPFESQSPGIEKPEPWGIPSLRGIAVGVWFGGALLWFAFAITRAWRIHRLIAYAKPAPPELREEIREICRQIGLKRCPETQIVSGVISPMVWAVGCQPRILMPSALLERFDTDERRTVLTHELAHIKRRDTWVRLAEFAASGLYWWFPVVWYVRDALRRAEEECCDAWVTFLLPDSYLAYASALLKTLEFFGEQSERRSVLHWFGSGVGGFRMMERRLTMIYRHERPVRLGGFGYAGLVVLSAIFLPVALAQAPPAPSGTAPAAEAEAVESAKSAADEPAAADAAANAATLKAERKFQLVDSFDKKFALSWKQVRPDPTHFSLEKNPGSLTITTQPGTIYGDEMTAGPEVRPRNLFLVPNPAVEGGDFVVTVCLANFRPEVPYQQAGLLVYDDDDNYVKWVVQHARYGPSLAFLKETNREAIGLYNDIAGVASFDRVWLRITKCGKLYRYATSTDGDEFQLVGQKEWGDGSPKWVGIVAKNSQAIEEMDAVFESFEVRSPSPDEVDSAAIAALEEIRGTWDVVVMRAAGKKVEGIRPARFAFEETELVVTEIGKPVTIPYHVEVRDGNKELFMETKILGEGSRAFFRREGETLFICFPGGAKFPEAKDWDAENGEGQLLVQFRRTPPLVVAAIRRCTGSRQKCIYRIDSNGDGDLALAEFQADWPTPEGKQRAAEVFNSLDRNEDGRVVYDEFCTKPKQAEFGFADFDLDRQISMEEFSVSEMSYAPASHVKKVFAALDQDGSGSLSYEEHSLRNDESWFVKLDVNEDGEMSLAEYSARNTRLVNNGTVKQVFSAMDRDGSGVLSLEEFSSKPVEAVFGMRDEDASNALELQEFLFWKRTPEEKEKGKAEFAERDADKSGGLSLREYSYRNEDELFWKADSNGNARLSRVEFERSEFGRSVIDIALVFRTLDRDHDNSISLTEFREYDGSGKRDEKET